MNRASFRCEVEVVKLLLGAGADTNIQDKVMHYSLLILSLIVFIQEGSNALMNASFKENKVIVELLIAAGVDLNIQNEVMP